MNNLELQILSCTYH